GSHVRKSTLAIFAAAVVCAAMSVVVGATAHDRHVRDLDAALGSQAAVESSLLRDYFARARAITLLTAQNPAFARFYANDGTLAARPREAGVRPVRGHARELPPPRRGREPLSDARTRPPQRPGRPRQPCLAAQGPATRPPRDARAHGARRLRAARG